MKLRFKQYRTFTGILLAILFLLPAFSTIQAAELTTSAESTTFKADLQRETKVTFHSLELTVPAGSSAEEMSVTWGNSDLTGIEIPFGVKLLRQQTYRFGPSGLKFSNDKKLRFRLKRDPIEYPGGFPSGLQLYYIDRETKRLELVPGGVNEQTGDFEAEIAHFSEYVPGINGNWMGDSLNPYADYINAGDEHVGIANLSLTVNSTVYSLPLRGGTQLNFTRVYHNKPTDNPFSISEFWSWDFPSFYTLSSRFGPGKLTYHDGSSRRYEAGGTVFEVHWTNQSPYYDYYFNDGTRIETRDGYETVYDTNGNWYRYDFTKFSGKDRLGNPTTILRVTSLKDCIGREFYFRYNVVDENVPYLNKISNCPRPYLEKVEQKMPNGSFKTIFRRTALSGTAERFYDTLDRGVTYEMKVPGYAIAQSNGLCDVDYNIERITYPNGVRSEYQYTDSSSYISSQKCYRPGALSPFRTTVYSFDGWYINSTTSATWSRMVIVNDGIMLKKYYLNANLHTDHEETYDAVTQKLLKKVQYTYDIIGIITNDYSTGCDSTEESPRPEQVITQLANTSGSLGAGAVYTYDYDNWGNTIYVKDPYGTVTRTTYNNTNSVYLDLSVYGMQNPQYIINYWFFHNRPATRAVIVTDPIHQTQKLQQTHYQYDTKGNLLTERVVQKTETGAILYLDTNYTYDNYGNPLTKTDPTKVNTLCYEYSAAYGSAYLTRVYKLDGTTLARYDYDYYTGLKTSATDPKGNVYHYEYDALGRETKEYLNDPDQNVTITKTITYDDLNNKVSLSFGNSTKGFQEGLITYDSSSEKQL